MKTQETLDLENALNEQCRKRREYGIPEVTVGFRSQGHGDEIADYMSMDPQGVFRCYELKVSMQDLKSDAKLSWYGDYNYLVCTEALYHAVHDWNEHIPPYCGILTGTQLKTRRKAKQRPVSDEQREMLKDSMIRSMFWKMENYRDASDLTHLRELEKKLEEAEEELQKQGEESRRKLWTYSDYELYYGRNHQTVFDLENAAKEERRQYFARKEGAFTWIRSADGYTCPVCGNTAEHETDFCPFCGADLRGMKEL